MEEPALALLPVDPYTLVTTARGAYKTYSWLSTEYEARKWRDMTYGEAEEVKLLLVAAPGAEWTTSVWPDRHGYAYVAVADHWQSGWRTFGVGWDRWVEQRFARWDELTRDVRGIGYRLDVQGIHGFAITAKRR